MMVIIQAIGKSDLQLGRQGENLARQVVFDLSGWVKEYGDGTAELIFQHPGDAVPYPVAAVRENSTLVWTLTAADTAVASSYGSDGHCELRYYVGETLVKSKIWRTWVEPALSTPSETAPPEPEQGWVDQVLAVGAAVKAATDGAKADAERAAALAAEVAEKAAQTARDATESAQAKEAAQTAQRLAEAAQSAAEAARNAAETAQAAVEQSATDAATAKQGAEAALKAAQDAAAAAAQALADLRALYQEMQTWAQGVTQDINDAGSRAVQSVQSAGDAQVQRVADEGTRQTANAKDQADAAARSADSAAQSAQQAAESAAVYDEVVTDVTQLKDDLADVDEVLNVKHLRKISVNTTGSYVRAIAFSGLSLISGHSYTFTVKPVSITTQEFYLYFVDSNGTETVINKKVDGNIVYDFTPTEDMNNVSIKVSSGASTEQTFEVTWIENVGDNEIVKVNTRVDNLFDGTNVVELSIYNGKFVTALSGYEGTINGDSNSCATSFIPVRPNDKVLLENLYLESNRSICGYDKDRNFVTVITKGEKSRVSFEFVVPENVYYIRATGRNGIAPTVTFLSIPNNLDTLRIENPIATITNGKFITRLTGYEGIETSAENSAVTGYIPIKPNSIVSIDNAYTASNRCTCAYDKNKKFISVLISSLDQSYYSKNIAIPSNARYIRITSKKDVVPTIKYVNTIIDGTNVSNPYVEGKELFDSSTLKPVLTFIDDDTWAIEYVTRQKELCDRLGIKCSFACLTEQVEKNDGLLELLLSYERDGFPIIFHANQQIVAYDTSTLDVVAEETDFVTGLQKMHKFGFSDYKIWCTPFGSAREDQKKLAYKWGFDGLVTSGWTSAYNNPYEYSSRFIIKRNSLGSNTDRTASDIVDDVANIKLAIDNASECNGWVCISTHSAYDLFKNGEADNAMEEIVNYAREKGFEIRTVNEELRRRMPIYRYYEQF